jgi:hypothetical protein
MNVAESGNRKDGAAASGAMKFVRKMSRLDPNVINNVSVMVADVAHQ